MYQKKPEFSEKLFQPVGEDTTYKPLPIEKLKINLLPAPIANIPLNIYNTQAIISWSPGSDESLFTYYLLDVSIDNFKTFIIGYQNRLIDSTTKIEVISGLKSYTHYEYRLRSTNARKDVSNYSNVISFYTSMNPPIANLATNIKTYSFIANWSLIPNGTQYMIDVGLDSLFTDFVVNFRNLIVNSNQITVTNLRPHNNYYYRIRAYNKSTNTYSNNSNIICAKTSLLAPIIRPTTSITTSSFIINWSLVQNAIFYLLDVSIDPSFNSFVSIYNNYNTGNVSNQSLTGLNSNTKYYIRLRSVDTNNNVSNNSIVNQAVTNITAPVLFTQTNLTSTSMTINWVIVPNVISYQFDLSTDNFLTYVTGFNSYSTISNSLNIINLIPNTTYMSRVRAVGINTNASTNSNVIITTTILTPPTTNPASQLTSNSFRANWDVQSNVVVYFIDVSFDINFISILPSYNNQVTNNNYYDINQGITQLTNYYYRIRSSNANGISANSNPISLKTSISPPVSISGTVITANSFVANWISVVSADNYYIDVSSDNYITYISNYQNRLVSSGTSLSVIGLSANTNYKYRVRSEYNAGTLISLNSNSITVLTSLNAPTANSATDIRGVSFTANWTSVLNVNEYRIDVSTDNFLTFVPGFGNLFITSSSISVSITGLTATTQYQYRIRALNVNSEPSFNSNVVSVTTISDSPIINGSDIFESFAILYWTSIDGATGYKLDVSIDPLFNTFVTGYQDRLVTINQETISDLNQLTNYYARVRAIFPTYTTSSSNTYFFITSSYTFQYKLYEGSGDIFHDSSQNHNDALILPTTPDSDYTIFNYSLTEGSGFSFNDLSDNLNNANIIVKDLILFTEQVSGKSAILLRSVDNSRITINISNDMSYDFYDASFSDDFTRIVFVRVDLNNNYQLGIMNSDGTNVMYVGINSSTVIIQPSLSPNSITILYQRYNLSITNSQIYLINIDGTNNTHISPLGLDYYTSPSWVSDNEIIYQHISMYSNSNSYTLDRQNLFSNIVSTIYTNIISADMYPSLSKDKLKIVFVSRDSSNKSNISIINIDGSQYLQLENTNFNNVNPKFSFDGSQIVFLSNRYNSRYYIFIINVNGSSVYKYTTNNLEIFDTKTRPDYGYINTSDFVFKFDFSSGFGGVLYDSSNNGNNGYFSLINPVTIDALNILPDGFTACWNPMEGITNYYLDISNDGFITFISGYNNLFVTGASQVVTNLSLGITYQYRVRATLDTLLSLNSNITNVTTHTLDVTPYDLIETNVTSTGFTANWTSNGSSYEFQLSIDNFITIIQDTIISTNIIMVSGLIPDIAYQWRVRIIHA